MENSENRVKITCKMCRSRFDVTEMEPFSRIDCPECGASLRIPMAFSRYLLECLVGAGGMAKVYRAIDPEYRRRVAIKILDREIERDEAQNFLDSAAMVEKLKHPGIVPVFDHGMFDNRVYLVMQYMPGGNTADLLKNGALPELPLLLRQLSRISDGLNYALTNFNLVHHDIKPANILVSGEEAKLSDFDLADVRSRYDEKTMCDGFGSPAYMSPERLYSGGEDFRGDVFSLGMTIYELITGELPFNGEGDQQTLLERRVDNIFTPLEERAPQVGSELCRIVDSMISFAPESRPEYPEITSALMFAAGICEEKRISGRHSGKLLNWLLGRKK